MKKIFKIILGVFGFLIFFSTVGMVHEATNKAKEEEKQQPQQIQARANPTPPPAPAQPSSPWKYEEQLDEMTGKNVAQAQVSSLNTIELEFPYNGGTKGFLILRKHPRYGNDVIFQVNKGQIQCSSSDCAIMIKFDDAAPILVQANKAEDGSSDILFLSGYNNLVKKLKDSKKVVVEITFFRGGAQHFAFSVEQLKSDF